MEISKESAKATLDSAKTKAKELADKIPDNPVTRTIGKVGKSAWHWAKNNKGDAAVTGGDIWFMSEVDVIDTSITESSDKIVDALEASDL